MIVRFPTGLYTLPIAPSDRGNVTFTISNTDPPRSNLLFPKVPVGIGRRRHSPRDESIVLRRSGLGELVYRVTTSLRNQLGNDGRAFEIGRVLEFQDAPIQRVEAMLVSHTFETRHDLRVSDYSDIGLSDVEQLLVEQATATTYAELVGTLNAARSARRDAEIDVATHQKLLNEVTRTIAALETVASTDPELSAILVKLRVKRTDITNARDAAIQTANAQGTLTERIATQLRAVSVTVR